MDAAALIGALESSGQALLRMVTGVPADPLRWKPAPERWSLLEILCHLCDEEREDFRRRLTLTLEDPGAEWPPIDPEGWVRDRDYAARDPEAMVADFADERAASLLWLHGLAQAPWDRTHEHGSLGALRAGDLLAAWAAHDLLHLGQMARCRLAWIQARAVPFTTRYAAP